MQFPKYIFVNEAIDTWIQNGSEGKKDEEAERERKRALLLNRQYAGGFCFSNRHSIADWSEL